MAARAEGHAGGGNSEQNSGGRNTVRLSANELSKLYSEMDAGTAANHPKRAFLRAAFQKLAVRVELHQAAGASTSLNYACRNLSGTGIGLVHSAYVHVGTRCTVHLPTLAGPVAPIPAKVVRCRHVKGLVHEVGIQFDQPINVRQFVELDPQQGGFAMEHVDPSRLSGSLLHIESSSMDRRLVRHYLRDTQLNITSVETAEEGLKRASEGFDVIMCAVELGEQDGRQVAQQLRAAGIQATIILVASDPRMVEELVAESTRANAHLVKPLSEQKLLRALGEFLLMGASNPDGGGAIVSTLSGDHPNAKFVEEFTEDLRQMASELNKAITSDDTAVVRRVALQIRGVAPELGFAVIAESAEAAMNAVSVAMSVTEAAASVRSLISMCMRARAQELGEKRKAG
jgi:CheY-like chemotaxis protein/HPt (histidine-containing phosphotransfer) domain-containing protein